MVMMMIKVMMMIMLVMVKVKVMKMLVVIMIMIVMVTVKVIVMMAVKLESSKLLLSPWKPGLETPTGAPTLNSSDLYLELPRSGSVAPTRGLTGATGSSWTCSDTESALKSWQESPGGEGLKSGLGLRLQLQVCVCVCCVSTSYRAQNTHSTPQ